jgi:hypothetical protein
MKSGHFLHCRDCETLFRPSLYDRAAEFRMTPDGFTEIVRDDCMDFLTRHARHQLETLRPTNPHAFYSGALWDVTAPTYWEVWNGEQIAVVEGRRSQLGSPLRYRLRTGRVVAERVTVEVPENDIRRQVDRALYPGVAPERKLAAFVEVFKGLVWNLDAAALEILWDVPGDPTLAAACLPAAALTTLSAAVHQIFDQSDSAKIIASLTGTDDDPDAFTVLVRQQVRVEG